MVLEKGWPVTCGMNQFFSHDWLPTIWNKCLMDGIFVISITVHENEKTALNPIRN